MNRYKFLIDNIMLLLDIYKIYEIYDTQGFWKVFFNDKIVFTDKDYNNIELFYEKVYKKILRKEKIKRLF